jgi:hypothetical protein
MSGSTASDARRHPGMASFVFGNAPHHLRVLAEMLSRDFQEGLPSLLPV